MQWYVGIVAGGLPPNSTKMQRMLAICRPRHRFLYCKCSCDAANAAADLGLSVVPDWAMWPAPPGGHAACVVAWQLYSRRM
jgi:hypothetical protein